MQSPLKELIIETACRGKENFLSLDPIKKFSLSSEFWPLYDQLFNNKDQDLSYSLLEIPQEDYSILRFDIDIYPTEKKEERLYTDKLITNIIKHLVSLILNTAGKECDKSINNPNHLVCCVFEKKAWCEKDGFHLIFPNLFIRHDFQDGYFVSKLQEYLDTLEVKNKILVDKISKKPWVVLGCGKKRSSNPYFLTAVYDKNLSLLPLSDFLPSTFSINKKSAIVYGKNFLRPVIKKERLPIDINADYELIVEWGLLNKLDIHRSENYDSWIEIGIVLYNIGCGEEKFLELWKDFSNRCPEKYNATTCETKWNTFTSRNITIRSLFFYFKKDDPQNFDKMVYHQNINKVYQGLFPSENTDQLKTNCVLENCHIAKIFFSKYCNDLVWAPSKGKNGSWYIFDGNRWIHIYEEVLRGKINGELCEYINELFDQILLDKSTDENEEVVKYLLKNQRVLTKKLNNITFIKQIVDASKSFFINQNFQKNLDANKYLIGCENGVIDLERKTFRDTSPDDFISMSTGIYYHVPSNNDIDELRYYLEDLFVDEELINNVLEIIASLLVGSNDDKNIIIALGPTNAGKTQLVKLFEKTLGDYAVTFPKELVYQRSISSSAARPELARVEGKRIAFINELSKDERMNVATVKELSGNDKFYARKLYADGGEITPMFTMYLSCNEVPRIPQDDEALWGRLLIINFESTFINDASDDRKEQLLSRKFSRISNLDETFIKLAPTLLWTLFTKYIENRNKYPKGIPKCFSIRNATKKFREANNPIHKFITERITIDANEGTFFKCTDLFTHYCNWYKSYFPDQKNRINKDQFKEEFVKYSKLNIVKEKPDEFSRKTEGWTHIIYGEKVEE